MITFHSDGSGTVIAPDGTRIGFSAGITPADLLALQQAAATSNPAPPPPMPPAAPPLTLVDFARLSNEFLRAFGGSIPVKMS